MAQIFVEGAGSDITSPFFDKNGSLFYLSHNTGEIFKISDPQQGVRLFGNSEGQPSGAGLDDADNMYIADFAHAAIVSVTDGISAVVSEYEGKSFKGPNSLVFAADGTMYFTDSGPLGETSLSNPTGSVYCITSNPGGQLLKPLALNSLAYPSGIALSPDDRIVYVAEMMANRVLRFVQRPTGVFHCSVFYQLSGGMGPSAIAVDRSGMIYVARYDLKGCSNQGSILVLNPEGKLYADLSVPAPEITGLAISPDKTSIFVTEASTSTIYRLPLQ